MPELKQLEKIVWNDRLVSQKPDIKLSGKDFLMDTMPFNAILKEKLTDTKPLQYLCEGKYISFKPVGGQSVKGLLSEDKRSVTYKDALGLGISLEAQASQSHWKKLIKLDALPSLDDGAKFLEFKFEVETDFDIPERENKKPRIKLGDNSFIEVAQAWDSSPHITDEETGDESENKITVKSFFKRENGKLYFIKQIPTAWLKSAVFPVYTDVDITYGTKSEFESGNTTYIRCCEIDTDKFVVVFQDNGDGAAGKARVATVSGTTITWGAVNEFCSDVGVGYELSVCKLDTDKFVVVYTDDAQADDGYARVGTVATRTISWGTAKEFETGDCEYASCCQLGTDKFAIVYNDEEAGDLGKVCICTVSTTTITAGSPVTFEGKIRHISCCKLDTDKFLAFYYDSGDSNKQKACAFTVSTTTPTAGTIKEIDADSCGFGSCAQLDTDKAVIVWRDGTNTSGHIEIVTISGTTITEGAEVDLNPTSGDINHTAVTKIDATHFVVVYEDVTNTQKGTSRYCSFSGTTITLGDEELFHDAVTSYVSVCHLGSGKIAVCYCDDADVGNIGEAIIGTMGAIDATVIVPLCAIDVAVNAPAMSLDSKVTIPLSEIAVAVNAPALSRGCTIVVPLSEISLVVLAPGVAIHTYAIVPLLEIDIAVLAPTLLRDAKIVIPVVDIDVAGVAPVVSISTFAIVPLLEMDLAALAPSLSLDMKPEIPCCAIDLAVIAPTLLRDCKIVIPTMDIDVAGVAPTLSLGTAITLPVLAMDVAVNAPGLYIFYDGDHTYHLAYYTQQDISMELLDQLDISIIPQSQLDVEMTIGEE